MRFLVDDEEIGSLNPPKFGFWELSPSDALDGVEINPWINGTIMAPFDQPVIIILHKCFQIIEYLPGLNDDFRRQKERELDLIHENRLDHEEQVVPQLDHEEQEVPQQTSTMVFNTSNDSL